MADPDPFPSSDADEEPNDASPSVASFDLEEDQGGQEAPEPEESTEETAQLKRRRTLIAVGAALVLSVATVMLARPIVTQGEATLGIGTTVGVGLTAFAVALAGMLPYRWGLWVVPFVAVAHYALNFYNMLFTQQSVYGLVPESAMGYAVLTPVIGVVLGWVLEGVYRLVAPE